MDEFIKSYFSGPYVNVASLLLGTLGIAYAVYVQRKNPIKKGLLYRSKGLNIVNKLAKDIPSLDIRFSNGQINVLSETTIHFWNSGNAGISFADIPAAAPISVVVPEGCQILTCTVIAKDGPGIDFDITAALGQRTLPFAVRSIERKKGALLKILHTAPDPGNAKLSGMVTDYGPPKLVTRRITANAVGTIFDVFFLTGLAALLAAILWQSFRHHGIWSAAISFVIICLPVGLVALFIGAALERILVRLRRHFVHKSVWAYERDELSDSLLKAIGDTKSS